jgi:hypothetical protein
MGGPTTNVFESPEWIAKLRRYAISLISRLESDLTAIAATGISLKAEDQQSLTIDPYRPRKQHDNGRADPLLTPRQADPLCDHSHKDVAFLQAWLAQPESNSKPLLLLAPFGCGKSVTLGLFTLILARTLRDWCQSPKPQNQLPWVPMPVRLRNWSGDETLWDYMATLSQERVNPDLSVSAEPEHGRLTFQELYLLREHRRLLPLFDGLDELPDSSQDKNGISATPRADAIRQIYQNPYYGCRHVLSSREGHGAEDSAFTATATLHTLHALDLTEAETFIRDQFEIGLGNTEHPILFRYREAQPAINELFRRPLFLTAWCTKAGAWQESRGRVELPASLSGLMEAVLVEVLDKRISDHRKGRDSDCAKVAEELLENRHRLGAVLAIHADAGFGMLVQEPVRYVEEQLYQHAFADAHQYRRYAEFASKAGLLIKRSNRTFVEKIPVVEYLIGYYYAWLAREHKDKELTRSRSKQLASAFQRRFWWCDHDEVWVYAFDLLWHGDQDQQNIAAGLVQWVLNLSGECVSNVNWDDPPSVGQDENDRRPFTCWRFVLRALLPTAKGVGEPEASKLVDEAMKQCEAEGVVWWQIEKKDMDGLDRVAQRRPELMNEWLSGCLGRHEYENEWPHIARTFYGMSQHVTKPTIEKLLECLRRLEYKRAWPAIASAISYSSKHLGFGDYKLLLSYLENDPYDDVARSLINVALGSAAKLLGPGAVEQLVIHLGDVKYEKAWDGIAGAIWSAVMHLDSAGFNRLLAYLGESRHQKAWENIACALWETSRYLGPSSVDQLLSRLDDKRHEQGWDTIADALYRASYHFDAQAVTRMLEYLNDGTYKKIWGRIAFAIGTAAVHIDHHAMNRLLAYLGDEKYERDSGVIGFAIGNAAIRLGPDAIKQLVTNLGDEKYKAAWCSIAYAIDNAAMHLDAKSVELLLTFLDDDQHEKTWVGIADTLSKAIVQPSPDTVKKLVTYLADDKYKDAWTGIINTLGNAATDLSADAIKKLLTQLGEEKYKKAWEAIANALARATTHIDVNAVKQLLMQLGEKEHIKAWSPIAHILGKAVARLGAGALTQARSVANDAARRGQIAYAICVADAVSLIWFVRDVHPQKEPGLRTEYGFAGRNDADLLLPADKRFAPLLIRRILGLATDEEQHPTGESPADWAAPDVAIETLLHAVNAHLKQPQRMTAFRKALGSERPRRTKLQETILPMVLDGFGPEVRRESIWYFKEKESRSTTKGVRAKKHGKDQGREAWSQLRVNLWYLRELREVRHADLVEKINQAVLTSRERHISWLKLKMPVVICSRCGFIHKLPEPSTEAAGPKTGKRKRIPQPLVGNCHACKKALIQPEQAEKHPAKYHHCTACQANYAIASVEGAWPSRRNSKYCLRADETFEGFDKKCQRIELIAQSRK